MTLTQNLKKIKKPFSYLVSTSILFLSSPAFANFTKAETMLKSMETGLNGLALVTVTIAIIWVGYKVLFGGSTLRECAPIIIGSIVIASGAEIAKLLV